MRKPHKNIAFVYKLAKLCKYVLDAVKSLIDLFF